MHVLTGNQPKKINLEKGVFECKGKFYYINLEAISFARLKRFAELLPVIVYGKSYLELAHFIHELRMKMTTGEESMRQVHFEVATALTQWDQYLLDNTGTFYENTMNDTLRFCALFMVEKGEDMNVVDDILIENKINDWKSEMDMMSFFLASRNQVYKFQELLQSLLVEKQKKEQSQELNIPEN